MKKPTFFVLLCLALVCSLSSLFTAERQIRRNLSSTSDLGGQGRPVRYEELKQQYGRRIETPIQYEEPTTQGSTAEEETTASSETARQSEKSLPQREEPLTKGSTEEEGTTASTEEVRDNEKKSFPKASFADILPNQCPHSTPLEFSLENSIDYSRKVVCGQNKCLFRSKEAPDEIGYLILTPPKGSKWPSAHRSWDVACNLQEIHSQPHIYTNYSPTEIKMSPTQFKKFFERFNMQDHRMRILESLYSQETTLDVIEVRVISDFTETGCAYRRQRKKFLELHSFLGSNPNATRNYEQNIDRVVQVVQQLPGLANDFQLMVKQDGSVVHYDLDRYKKNFGGEMMKDCLCQLKKDAFLIRYHDDLVRETAPHVEKLFRNDTLFRSLTECQGGRHGPGFRPALGLEPSQHYHEHKRVNLSELIFKLPQRKNTPSADILPNQCPGSTLLEFSLEHSIDYSRKVVCGQNKCLFRSKESPDEVGYFILPPPRGSKWPSAQMSWDIACNLQEIHSQSHIYTNSSPTEIKMSPTRYQKFFQRFNMQDYRMPGPTLKRLYSQETTLYVIEVRVISDFTETGCAYRRQSKKFLELHSFLGSNPNATRNYAQNVDRVVEVVQQLPGLANDFQMMVKRDGSVVHYDLDRYKKTYGGEMMKDCFCQLKKDAFLLLYHDDLVKETAPHVEKLYHNNTLFRSITECQGGRHGPGFKAALGLKPSSHYKEPKHGNFSSQTFKLKKKWRLA